eukprot:TRINITY_DN10219_c0_g1_i1.p2 TRINITY_DN10219_c0_g1~~TRINITY_DN10219_c0_g1_i1.p2  ORF type:complete len:121 (-),score=14.53 TRINITY_DN10219_c0_g1_i1:66-428(-)
MCNVILYCLPFECTVFFFNDTATTEIYTLSLHDALPISPSLSLLRIHHALKLGKRYLSISIAIVLFEGVLELLVVDLTWEELLHGQLVLLQVDVSVLVSIIQVKRLLQRSMARHDCLALL